MHKSLGLERDERARLRAAGGGPPLQLRDAAGVADVPLPLRLTLRAGDTLPSSCSLLRAAALTTPLRAGDEREVLVQCRDAYGNAAAAGQDAVTLTLTPRGGGGGGVRAAAALTARSCSVDGAPAVTSNAGGGACDEEK